MTKDEAMKLALEALKWCHGGEPCGTAEAITALEKALAEHAMRETQRLGQEIEQEPVAIKRMKEWIEYLKRKSDFGQNMKIPSEMSAGTCWELALELEQFINTTPPQRTWVGLTDEGVYQIYGQVEQKVGDHWETGGTTMMFPITLYQAIEAELKQKNGYAEENT